MIYFKNKNNDVYAYTKNDLEQSERITELELLLRDIEPTYNASSNNLTQSEIELVQAQSTLDEAINKIALEDDGETNSANNEELEKLTLLIAEKQSEYEDALNSFNSEKAVYQPIKDEYDAILPIFFNIRENLKTLKEMSQKEVDTHLNPPTSKEQLIVEAEQQKQALLAEANSAIAPLQYAENLGIATAEESASLVDWQKYSVCLNRVDTSTAPDIDWPQKP